MVCNSWHFTVFFCGVCDCFSSIEIRGQVVICSNNGPIYLYWKRIIRLGRAWAKNGSSLSVYKYGQADGSSVLTSYPLSTMVRLTRQTILIARVDGLLRLLARIYIRRATVLCPSSSQTDDPSPVKIGPLCRNDIPYL